MRLVKIKKIIIENTQYSIMLYLLLIDNWKEDIFILSDIFDKNFIENFRKICKKVYIVYPTSIKQNFISYYMAIFKLYIFLIKIKLKNNIEIYGNDNLTYSLLKKVGYILLEDGIVNYQKLIKQNFKRKIINLIKLKNPFYNPYGYSKYVKKIYLTGLAPIPKEIKDKVEIINLKELWNKKSDKEKEEVLNIFGFNNEIINNLKGKNKILYTQPLSEDGIISENEKIKLYRQIVKNYDEKELIIKKHPREKTDYKTIFIKAEVLNQSFPAELFDLLDIKFKKAITIFSTAVLSDKEIEIDFYGTEIHPKLIGRFGSMENVMKRNAYLDGDLNE